MIEPAQKNPKHFVVARYEKTNDSFPSKLDVMVNGHAGILIEGQPCLLPRFLVAQALASANFTHRDRPATQGSDPKNDEQETIRVKPNIDIFEIADEYQSPEGVAELLKESKQIKDREHAFYRLRMGCKNLVFGDMTPARVELGTGLNMTSEAPVLSVEEEARQEVESEIREEKKVALKAKMRAEMLAGDKGIVEAAKEKPQVFEFGGQTYKSESAMKAAITRAEKKANDDASKLQAQIDDHSESVVMDEEEAIEVDV